MKSWPEPADYSMVTNLRPVSSQVVNLPSQPGFHSFSLFFTLSPPGCSWESCVGSLPSTAHQLGHLLGALHLQREQFRREGSHSQGVYSFPSQLAWPNVSVGRNEIVSLKFCFSQMTGVNHEVQGGGVGKTHEWRKNETKDPAQPHTA